MARQSSQENKDKEINDSIVNVKNDIEEFIDSSEGSKESIEEKTVDKKASEVLDKINESVDAVSDTVKASKRYKVDDNIPLDEDIPCKSVTFGGLTWISQKTNSHYRWNDIGDIEYIPFGELITLNNTKREYLFTPMFVVQDERVIKYFRLLDTYEKIAQVHNLEAVFKGTMKEISEVIDTAINVNMRNLLISKVRQMRRDGTLNNIDIIKLLEKKLKFDISVDNAINTNL